MLIPRDRLARAGIRAARSAEDLRRAGAFLNTPRLEEIVASHSEERGCVRLLEADDEILAAVLFDPTPIRIRDVSVRCARLAPTGGEDGTDYFLETGDTEVFDLLHEEFLGYLWARRYPVAYAHGSLALFSRQGFVPVFSHPRVSVPVPAARKLPSPYRVRHLKSDDVKRIVELRDRNRTRKPQVFALGVPPFHHFCVEGPDRKLRGYFSLETSEETTRTPPFFAPEAEAEDRAAACTILQHCANRAAEIGLREFHLPVAADHPVGRLALALGGTACTKGPSADPFSTEEMVHVVDPARLVEALEPVLSLALARADLAGRGYRLPVRTERGSWTLVAEGGKALLSPDEGEESAPSGLRLPHWELTQLLFGFLGPDELEAELEPEAADLLAVLFPKAAPLSMPDPEFWEDVDRSANYGAEAAAVIAHTAIPWAIASGPS